MFIGYADSDGSRTTRKGNRRMEDSIVISRTFYENQNLYVNTFGHSVTRPLHKFGPAVRPYFLIHFILEGKGKFMAGNISYELGAGQGFLIAPDHPTTYIADEKEPWTYVWIGFSGAQAEELVSSIGLSMEQPVFSGGNAAELKEIVFAMLRHNSCGVQDSLFVTGQLYHFLSCIAASNKDILPKTDESDYVNQAVTYIQNHITEPVQVEEIARYVGLNRSYLSTLFRKKTGYSPIQYIQNARITKAKHLLESSRIPVSAIAFSCGYQKPESLIRLFRQRYGVSPAVYRKQIREQKGGM